MSRYFVQLPNGTFGEFSTVVDNFVSLNQSKEDLKQEYLKAAEERFESQFKHFENDLTKRSYEDYLREIEFNHGQREAKRIEKALTSGLKIV